MKAKKIKRAVYHSISSGEIFISAEEYDGRLTDANILGAIHEIGKTAWVGRDLWVVRGSELIYRISIEEFTQYTKSWFDYIMDAVRRI